MSAEHTETLSYELAALDGSGCRLEIDGAITLDACQSLLTQLWEDDEYLKFRSMLCDLSRCELPEFNVVLRIAQYIAREKRGRGPTIVAFLSPDFASSTLVRAFRGFESLVKLKINFFAEHNDAIEWLQSRESAEA